MDPYRFFWQSINRPAVEKPAWTSDGSSPLTLVGYDSALIGYCHRGGYAVAVYDYDKLVTVAQELGNCDAEEASEFVDYNVVQAYFGPQTPVIVFALD